MIGFVDVRLRARINKNLGQFIFLLSTINSKYVRCNFLPMTEFEPLTSGIGSNHYANWATTTVTICI